MERKIRISGGLYACLLALFLSVGPGLILPGVLVKVARQEAWLSLIIAGAGASLAGVLTCWIALQFGRHSPGEAARIGLGRLPGALVSLFYAGCLLWISSLTLRQVQDFGESVILPGTPGILIGALMSLVALYGVWAGLEPLARFGFTVLAATLLLFGVLPLLLLREFRLLHVDPFLLRGILPVLDGSLTALDWLCQVVIGLSLIPHLNRPQQAIRWTLVGVAGATLILAFLAGLTVLIFGPILPSRLTYSTYYLFQAISLAQFMERVDVLVVLVWLTGMFIRIGLSLHAAAEAVADGLGLRSHRWAAVALTLAGQALTFIWPGGLDYLQWGTSEQKGAVYLAAEATIVLLFGLAALLIRLRERVAPHG